MHLNSKNDFLYRSSLVGVLLFSVLLSIKPVICFDVFYYIEAGKGFFENNYNFIEKDLYLFPLEGASQYVSHEWGSVLFTYLLYNMGGINLLLVAKTFLVVVTISVPIVFASKLEYRSFLTPLFVSIAAYAFSFRFFLRTDLVTTMFCKGSNLYC
jgi:hypothetical protein